MEEKMKTNTNKSLNYQIRQFGLNPQEWILKPFKRTRVFLINKCDENLVFLGSCIHKNNKIMLNELTLFSL